MDTPVTGFDEDENIRRNTEVEGFKVEKKYDVETRDSTMFPPSFNRLESLQPGGSHDRACSRTLPNRWPEVAHFVALLPPRAKA